MFTDEVDRRVYSICENLSNLWVIAFVNKYHSVTEVKLLQTTNQPNHSNNGRIEGQKNGDRNIQNACARFVFFCPHLSVRYVVVKSFILVIRPIRGFLSLIPDEGGAG